MVELEICSLIQVHSPNIESFFYSSEPIPIGKNTGFVPFIAVSIESYTPSIDVEITQPAEMDRSIPESLNILLPRLAKIGSGMFITFLRFFIGVDIAKDAFKPHVKAGIFSGILRFRMGQYPLANQRFFFLRNLPAPEMRIKYPDFLHTTLPFFDSCTIGGNFQPDPLILDPLQSPLLKPPFPETKPAFYFSRITG
jgi:hypothetical protein